MASPVETVALPNGSLVAELPFDDYADAYRIALDEKQFPDVDAFARAFVDNPPTWAAALMGLRDAVVGVIGLKKSSNAPTAAPEGSRLAPGDFVGFFRVVARNEREILAGEDDRHLDFRVSFLRGHDDRGCFGIVSTVVKFHGALGRAYFLPVAPVHRRLVPAMLSRAGDLRRART